MVAERAERVVDCSRRRGPRLEKPSEIKKESWSGFPGGEYYHHTTRVGENRRMDNLIGSSGKALATKEFTWAQLSETVFDELRKAEIEKRIEQRISEAEDQGEEIGVVEQIRMRSEVTEEVESMFKDSKELNIFSNTLKACQSRLEIVTGEIPEVFQNIEGVKEADGYLLVSGSRADNEHEIFVNFERLGNAGGNTKLDRIFSHRGGLTEGHGDEDFFGWKVTIEGRTFVFIWDPREADLAGDTKELDVDREDNDEAEGKNVINLNDRRKQKKDAEAGGGKADKIAV